MFLAGIVEAWRQLRNHPTKEDDAITRAIAMGRIVRLYRSLINELNVLLVPVFSALQGGEPLRLHYKVIVSGEVRAFYTSDLMEVQVSGSDTMQVMTVTLKRRMMEFQICLHRGAVHSIASYQGTSEIGAVSAVDQVIVAQLQHALLAADANCNKEGKR